MQAEFGERLIQVHKFVETPLVPKARFESFVGEDPVLTYRLTQKRRVP